MGRKEHELFLYTNVGKRRLGGVVVVFVGEATWLLHRTVFMQLSPPTPSPIARGAMQPVQRTEELW